MVAPRVVRLFLSVLAAKLNDTERSKLGGALKEKTFAPGDAIVQQGEVGKEFYIIRSVSTAVLLRLEPR